MKRCLWIVALLSVLLLLGSWTWKILVVAQAPPNASLNGDTNGDGERDLSDGIYLLNWLFLGGPEPVAIAGGADLEARVEALESDVASLQESASSPEALVEAALDSLRALATNDEEVWNFPPRLAPKLVTTNNAQAGAWRGARVLGFKLHESLSEPPRLDIVLAGPLATFVPVKPGDPLRLDFQDGDGALLFHGEVGTATLAGLDAENAYVRITAFNKLHRLTRGRKSRVFQEMSSPDIARRLLEQAGVSPSEIELHLEKTYPPREYIVQYNESDFDFLSRLLELDSSRFW